MSSTNRPSGVWASLRTYRSLPGYYYTCRVARSLLYHSFLYGIFPPPFLRIVSLLGVTENFEENAPKATIIQNPLSESYKIKKWIDHKHWKCRKNHTSIRLCGHLYSHICKFTSLESRTYISAPMTVLHVFGKQESFMVVDPWNTPYFTLTRVSCVTNRPCEAQYSQIDLWVI